LTGSRVEIYFYTYILVSQFVCYIQF